MNAVTILPRLRSLRAPVIDAGLDEVDDDVGEHLGVDAEVALVAQGQRRRRRDRADAQLERRPVRDEVGDVLADPPLDLADRRLACAYGGTSHLDRQVDVRRRGRSSRRASAASARLNWTMTVFAARIAACIASTDVPSEQKPWASGGVTLTKTASSGSMPARRTAAARPTGRPGRSRRGPR